MTYGADAVMTSTQTFESRSSGELQRPRILIVDDSPTILAFCRGILEEEGYEVATAGNVFVSPVIMEVRPHLVLMDVHLGVSLGTLAVEALKRCAFARETQFVLYSSVDEEELAALCRECGADAWFCKTHDPAELVERVRVLLARHPSRDSLQLRS